MTTAERILRAKQDIDEAYDAGKAAGGGGMSDFWDIYQNYGNRSDYSYFAAGRGWTDDNYNPKYPIKLNTKADMTYAYMMFAKTRLSVVDLSDYDITELTNPNYMFYLANCVEVKNFDCSAVTALSQTFQGGKMTKIELSNISPDCTFSTAFNTCSALKELTLTNCTIGKNGFNVRWSTSLSADSLKNIVDSLSSDTTGLTVTLPTTAEANYNANPPENAPTTWEELVATKLNWTFAYA